MNRLLLLDQLADQILSVECPHPIRVAIDGVDAAGKTTLANELVQPLQKQVRPVIRASIDGFHNPRAVRYKRGPDSPEGYFYNSFDYAAITARLLEPLGANGNRRYQTAVFDFRTDSPLRSPVEHAPDNAILLFDGVFLLRSELYPYWDFKIFVDVGFETAVERATQRDQYLFGTAKDARRRYWKRYVPGQRLYLQRHNPRGYADVVIKNDDPMNPTMHINVMKEEPC